MKPKGQEKEKPKGTGTQGAVQQKATGKHE